MKKIIFPVLVAAILAAGCNAANPLIFGNKTPIEKYGEKLADGGLSKTPEGREWLSVSKTALLFPVSIQLPYKQAGNFSPAKPQALGLSFTAKQGQRLLFNLAKKDSSSFVLYAELYKQSEDGETKLIKAVDTNVTDFDCDVAETGTYLLKLQPQLFRAGMYSLSITLGPSLSFPVAGKKAYIGSVWGDNRDGGKRAHEGVDIFAPKHTPALAAADGIIVGVREGGLGGKTVLLRPDGQNLSLYYAHLDEQLVHEGQLVKKGDTVGLVGNTGNARYTPSHLHFGIYGIGGAIDPFPFVNRSVKTSPTLPSKKMPAYVRFTKDVNEDGLPLKKNTLALPVAVNSKGYIAELPDGRIINTLFSSVAEATQPLRNFKATEGTVLRSTLISEAAKDATVPVGSSVLVLGYFNGFAFVRTINGDGWILEAAPKA
jgi:murein DD-endopeptidase MepM/ murein hydrolase activator NlpD